ncbi:uncharacterized protein LOC142521120 isoform X1 [Primulina tabacum]|uniref:uncharacterized protein LOC142521120 isoform X1 n=1 Tax=Primulina tabacum TaxID=48773 RepID=UPI003F5A2B77
MFPGNGKDDEPPPLKVIPAAETPKPLSPAIYDEEETSYRDVTLRQITYKDLRDSIARMRRMDSSTTFLLPDGGTKLRARLTCHEKELKRRKHQKDDEKCKDTSSVDELTCIDAKDGISPGTSSSRPASKSTFAKCLIERMGDKVSISIGETESFKEEIATLKQCDSKNTSANRQSRFWNAQRIEFPSRQTPFKSPGYLSVKINKQTQSNGKQLGRHSSRT